MEKTKICTKCGDDKPLSSFGKCKNYNDGLNYICKICACDARRLYYLNNLDKEKKRFKKYCEENPDRVKETKQKYYKNNKEKIKEYHIRTYNPKKAKINNKLYRRLNADKERMRKKIWNETNRDKVNEYAKKYRKDKPHEQALRNILRGCLRRMGQHKEGHTIDLLGYSALELKNHISALFTEGMSWDNYGEWHIDHIKTVISFDKDTHPSIVNALSNLRPLWATTREINGVIYEGNLNRG